MNITLPEALQQKAEALAQREGIDLETLVIRAVERLVAEPSQLNPRVEEARRRLQELNRRKLKSSNDFITDVRLAKARAYQLYLDNEEYLQSSAQAIAESRASYQDESDSEG